MEKVNNHSIIHNLSNHKLTLAEITVLNKGLTFSTTESKINEVELDNDMQRLSGNYNYTIFLIKTPMNLIRNFQNNGYLSKTQNGGPQN